MKSFLKKSTAVAAVSLLAACEGQVAGDVSSSSFGSATSSNLLSQAVSLQGSLLAALQAQFRAAAPDMINFGLRRAQAAVIYMISRGVRRGQGEAVSSFGETRPLINTQNPERLNRRTVTEVVGLDRSFRGYDFDGKKAVQIYEERYLGLEDEGG